MLMLGREITGDFTQASRREWLLTDGLGGWASGTISGANTRRYHGLFVPALAPPLGRTVLVTKFNDWATVGNRQYPLSSNEYADGTIHPEGFRHIESFRLEDGLPVWTYALGDTLLEKRIWLGQQEPAAYVAYRCVRGSTPIQLEILPMVTMRDSHAETAVGGWTPHLVPTGAGAGPGVRIEAWDRHFWVQASAGSYEPIGVWHWGIRHRLEVERGLPWQEDQYAGGRFVATLRPGATDAASDVVFTMSLQDTASSQPGPSPRSKILKPDEPEWIQQLRRAAEQFLVRRGEGVTVIAGYHWFGDWGRDTMISLPGLCLANNRPETAASILRTWAGFMREGLLPNRFPDGGDAEYNTADATLWYLHAVDRYVEATKDLVLLQDLWPVLEAIMLWHVKGTRHGIQVDAEDGLLRAGEPGVAVTWMDARVDGWVVTPRIGKPVEINALWINAVRVMALFAKKLKRTPRHDYVLMANQGMKSFDRYWNGESGCLFDVLDGPDGADGSIRPNQLLAVSLPYAPLSPDRPAAKAVVDVCAEHLLTSSGLRSLSASDRSYVGRYEGPQASRDGAYHQGTVWAWLMGPFVEAHLRVYQDTTRARSYLDPFESHLQDYGIGTIAEIFDGDPPHRPRGCIAQAWSVAEVLRVWPMLR